MITALRYTPQKQQELRSRHQLSERLTDFGWLPVVPEDLGEDFIVHIYHEGRATGVNFYIQLKSVTNLKERCKGNHISYSFKVKDLTHWEQFALPVVLIIWDVKLREGRWALLSESIQKLNQIRPEWRTQATRVIHIPWHNTTDNDGLKRLREEIGQFMYPNLPIGQSSGRINFIKETKHGARLNYAQDTGHARRLLEAKMELIFPDSLEGKSNRDKFKFFVQTGEKVVLENIGTKIKVPEWYKSLFGDILLIQGNLEVGSRPQSQTLPASISISDNEGYTSPVQNVDFKLVAVGNQTVTWSNEHQKAMPLLFTIVANKSHIDLNLTVAPVNSKVDLLAVRDALKFMQSFTKGGKLQLVLSGENDEIIVALPANSAKEPGIRFVENINMLCKIQERTGQLFQINPTEGFKSPDVETIYELTSIINTGKLIMRKKDWSERLEKEKLRSVLNAYRQTERITIGGIFGNSQAKLLEKKIELGGGFEYLTGKVYCSTEELKEKIRTLPSNQSLELKLVDVVIVQVFPDWFRYESKRLGRILAEKFEVNSVYLFGSLAWGETFTPDTDIDLAVSGIESEKFYKAIGHLERETEFPFDLINLEEAPPTLREQILKKGKLLYEREPLAIGG